MITLTVTAKRQITLNQEIMSHLGIKPGEQIELHLLPDGKAMIQAAPKKSIKEVIGFLVEKTNRVATLEQINEAVTKGWSGEQ